MIGLGSDAKVLVYTKPIDFRCGIDTLTALIQNQLGLKPFSGVAYVFRSKRRDRLKILWWDQTGIWLMTKRAESREGFSWPGEHDGTYRLNASQFAALVSGIYHLEDRVRGHAPDERLAVRRAESGPLLAELKAYLLANKRRFSVKGKMHKAISYVLNHWDGLTRFIDDGRIELDTNVVERCIKPQALTRKNSLFSATHEGAQNWAVIASLLETCRLNAVDPLAWTTATLTKLAQGHSSKDLEVLMPWNFAKPTA